MYSAPLSLTFLSSVWLQCLNFDFCWSDLARLCLWLQLNFWAIISYFHISSHSFSASKYRLFDPGYVTLLFFISQPVSTRTICAYFSTPLSTLLITLSSILLCSALFRSTYDAFFTAPSLLSNFVEIFATGTTIASTFLQG